MLFGQCVFIDSRSPDWLSPWLSYTESITEKLRRVAGDATLDLLRHGWGEADAWDKQRLNMEAQRVLHREIIMYAFDIPCWYARTIIPHTTYQVHPLWFDRIKKESLTGLLFNESTVKRSALVYMLLEPDSIPYQWLPTGIHHDEKQLWGRLSTFLIGFDAPFYLFELFLPGLERYSH